MANYKIGDTSGRVTVEMALLLPGIILWIVWLVFFTLLLMDMGVLKSETIRLSEEASFLWDKDGEPDTGIYPVSQLKSKAGILPSRRQGVSGDSIRSRFETRLKDRLVLTRCQGIKVATGKQNVSVQGSLSFRWPFPGLSLPGVNGLSFRGKSVTPVKNWEQWLRIVAAARQDSQAKNGQE